MDSRNHVASLNEYAQRRRLPLSYDFLGSDGPDHNKTFTMRAVIGGNLYPNGVGKTKKDAKQDAAKNALTHLLENGNQDPVEPSVNAAEASAAAAHQTTPRSINYISWLNEYGQKNRVDVRAVESAGVGANQCCHYVVDDKTYPSATGATKREAKERAAKLAHDEIGSSENTQVNARPRDALSSMASCPICNRQYPRQRLVIHASTCGESISDVHGNALAPLPHHTSADPSEEDWRTVADPKRALWLFTQGVLRSKRRAEVNRFSVDLRKDLKEQDRSYVSFYKRRNVEWASPLKCILEGDAAIGKGVNRHVMSTLMLKLRTGFHLNLGYGDITRLFDGQQDHLVPANSIVMLDNELFLMAGRMMGHCFMYGGPGFPGVSPAITHVLCGGSIDSATVVIEDCPDLDIRETIQLVTENSELEGEERDSVVNLCMAWDLPLPTLNNRKWLHDKLLLHAVIGRSARQVKQLRKGLKETGIWLLLSNRADVVKLLFPCEKEAEITPQMILSHITWPTMNPVSTRVTAYFRTFIEQASSEHLKDLLRFWVGWEVPPEELIVKVASGRLPRAATCFLTITLPDHHTTYEDFESHMVAAITSCDTGFGRI
ncbi:G2/M phase-specific E3 ubiquitin-protein ligase-like isoform X1 [Labrus mixtus]|uniref:G2/M phase-specific E3 ubiquitin-protein ligase-like isoform X1 n=1 Tax=Labrus mixtus TaxID=508554 RepID=UPI0029C09EC1|nr:G2/M phase-specific E3 ubiquitin-protein ligase-like isoform X1 [Labrus mixtus]